MIHTIQFYINIEKNEINFLENKYGNDILGVQNKLNNIYASLGIAINLIVKNQYGCRILFTVDCIKLLNKSDISEYDIDNINSKLNDFKKDIIGNEFNEEVLIRIDYRYDIELDKIDRETLLYLYCKTFDKYKFQKKYDKFKTTIYFNSKSIQAKIYDKECERNNKNEAIKKYEKNILRFEVAIRNQHLNYKKRNKSIDKNLKNYLNKETYRFYMEKNLEIFLNNGDYYTIYNARKLILNSSIKNRDKEYIIDLLKYISKYGISKARDKCGKYKFKKYLKILNELKINPILIPKNLKGAPSFIKNPFNLCA